MKSALSNFQTLPLKDAASQLLAKLGYKSDKFIAGAGSSPKAFLDLFGSGHTFDEKKALFDEWKTADLLFQLTDQELSRQSSLFADDSVLLGMLKKLSPTSEFSHCRAVAIAFESLRDPVAAKPLADLLRQEGMTGYAVTEISEEIRRTPASFADTSTRNTSLRELVLARALYRCGDCEGLAEKILKTYANDLRGHYATHAKAILAETKK